MRQIFTKCVSLHFMHTLWQVNGRTSDSDSECSDPAPPASAGAGFSPASSRNFSWSRYCDRVMLALRRSCFCSCVRHSISDAIHSRLQLQSTRTFKGVRKGNSCSQADSRMAWTLRVHSHPHHHYAFC